MRTVTFTSIQDLQGDLLILPVCQGEALSAFADTLDKELHGAIRFNMSLETFQGKKQEHLFLTTNGLSLISKILLVGLGPRQSFTNPSLQEMGGFMAQLVRHDRVLLDLTSLDSLEEHFPFGMLLKEWRFEKYKSQREANPARSLQCLCNTPEQAQERFDYYAALFQGISLARELTAEPANYLFPESFAVRCMDLHQLGIDVEVLDEAQLELEGAQGILSVARGSCRPPRLVVLKWMGGGEGDPPVALVGKGVCFDSGGINIKTSGSELLEMKWDKAGAATVTGILKTLALCKMPVNVVGVLGLVENMPDGKSFKPGDVITMLSGKTVEVMDTDNEGRLVLADCMWMAQQKYSPTIVIDLGTLTLETFGALAGEYAGLFCDDQDLARSLIEAGNTSGEKLWPLPLGEPFARQIQSSVADIRNMGILGFGESSAAAEFLKCFVQPNVAWAHLDISGVFCNKEEALLHCPGVTGFGVRLLVEWLRSKISLITASE
ncbi:MAG: leucyl aminopeptidase family protein [Parachlamydia sp.]|nr:leucyl aminopeptidase family protein [Parachlamydia sp.]